MPNYYNPYQYYPQPMQQSIQQAQQIQNNGFISVRNESEARNYPVAPGNSITFKDENAPYVYTKTMGFSQLDRPSFEKYKLIKEDISDIAETVDVDSVKADIDKLWGEVNAIKTTLAQSSTTTTRRKKDGDIRHDEQSE